MSAPVQSAVFSAPARPWFERLAQSQTAKLDALIAAAIAARPDAAVGLLFASQGGKALVNAAFDLFECDDLYRLASDVSHDMGEVEE